MRCSRTGAKTLPGTDRRVIGLWLLQSVLEPFPLYKDTIIPFFHSEETLPVCHTAQNSLWSSGLAQLMEYFSNSAVIPSEPGDLSFLSFLMALMTSSREGAAVDIC